MGANINNDNNAKKNREGSYDDNFR